ncbi:DUF6316 family protein [Pleionea sediminis]|uniref:DUF6316 family protein n=1 Tax=Pleionea sediminis TaxID=2569479 RepID=UPI001185ED5E|nr:DUF6316 family protein [Pleionea sediminis]
MRKTDFQNRSFRRTSRYIQKGRYWYFKTREGDLLGPFEDIQTLLKMEWDYISLMDQHVNSTIYHQALTAGLP